MAEPIGPVRQSGAVPPTYLSSQETTNSIISRILKQLREGEYKEALQTLKANEDRLGYTPEKIRVIRLVISTWDRVYSLYKTPEDFSRALEVVDNNIPPVPAGRETESAQLLRNLLESLKASLIVKRTFEIAIKDVAEARKFLESRAGDIRKFYNITEIKNILTKQQASSYVLNNLNNLKKAGDSYLAARLLGVNWDDLIKTNLDAAGLASLFSGFVPVESDISSGLPGLPPENMIKCLLPSQIPADEDKLKEIAGYLTQIRNKEGVKYFNYSLNPKDPKRWNPANNKRALWLAVQSFYNDYQTEIAKAIIQDGPDALKKFEDGLKNKTVLIYESLVTFMKNVASAQRKAPPEVRPSTIEPLRIKGIKNNLEFAIKYPFAALKIKVWRDQVMQGLRSSLPETVTDDLSKEDLEEIVRYLSGGLEFFHYTLNPMQVGSLETLRDKYYKEDSPERRLIIKLLGLNDSRARISLNGPERVTFDNLVNNRHLECGVLRFLKRYYYGTSSARPYLHRPLNEPEIEILKQLQTLYAATNVNSPESQLLESLLQIPNYPRVALERREVEALCCLARGEIISLPGNLQAKKEEINLLFSELKASYYADVEAMPEDARSVESLINLIWGSGPKNNRESDLLIQITSGADKIILPEKCRDFFRNYPAENFSDLPDSEKGLFVLMREALALRADFDLKVPKKYESNPLFRGVKDSLAAGWSLLTQGSNTTQVQMGINGVENWRLIILKRQYLDDPNKKINGKTPLEIFNSRRKALEREILRIHQELSHLLTRQMALESLVKSDLCSVDVSGETSEAINKFIEEQEKDKFKYDKDFHHLTVKGVMTQNEKEGLMKCFGEQNYGEGVKFQSKRDKDAVGTLYEISQNTSGDKKKLQEEFNNNKDRVLKLTQEYQYNKGRLDVLFKELLTVDAGFFEWFVQKFAGESNWPGEVLNFGLDFELENDFQLRNFNPFTAQEIHLRELSEKLRQALKNPAVQKELQLGWTTLDPAKGSRESAEAKMALALLIGQLKQVEGAKDQTQMENVNPSLNTAGMIGKKLFFDIDPVFHLGATIKSDLMQVGQMFFEQSPVMRGMLLERMANPDEMDVYTVKLLKAIISLRSPNGENDEHCGRLDKVIENLQKYPDQKLIADSDHFYDKNVQEIMNAYYYLGKIFSGEIFPNGLSEKSWFGRRWDDLKSVDITCGMFNSFLEATGLRQHYGPVNPNRAGHWGTYSGRTLGKVVNWGTGLEIDWTKPLPAVSSDIVGLIGEPGRELIYSFYRFGFFMGVQLGAAVPSSILTNLGRGLVWNRLSGRPCVYLVTDERGKVKEDSKGDLVFDEKGLGEAATQAAQLAFMFFLFNNDPFLLFDWLGVPEDLEKGDWVEAIIKIWVANFYLLQPGKNGMWDSVYGRFISLDRYAWRIGWNIYEGIKGFLGKLSPQEKQTFLEKVNGTPLEKACQIVNKYKSFGEYWREFAPKKGTLGALAEFLGDRESVGKFISNKIVQRSGKIAGGIGKGVLSPPKVLFETAARKANRNTAWRVTNWSLNRTTRALLETGNLLYWEVRAYRRATTSSKTGSRWGPHRLDAGNWMTTDSEYNPSLRRVKEFNVRQDEIAEVVADSLRLLARPAAPRTAPAAAALANARAVSGPSHFRALAEPEERSEFGEPLRVSTQENWTPQAEAFLYQIATENDGSPRRVTFLIQTGPNEVKAVTLPVKKIFINSMTAAQSGEPFTIVPSVPAGLPLTPEFAHAEIHINQIALGQLGFFEPAADGQESIILGEFNCVLERVQTVPLDDKAFYQQAKLLTVKEFKELLQKNGITLDSAILEKDSTGKDKILPLTREMTLDLIETLKRKNKIQILSRELPVCIETTVSQFYRPPQTNNKLSDRLVFELCGNEAEGNYRKPILIDQEGVRAADPDGERGLTQDFQLVPEQNGRQKFRLTDSGRQKITEHVRANQNGRPNPALEAQVLAKVELYLEAQNFARKVEIKRKGLQSQDDSFIKAKAQKLLEINESGVGSLTFDQMVESGAVFAEAVRRVEEKNGQKNVILSPSQLMAGFIGSMASRESPVFIDLGTGEGKTYAIGLDQFISLVRGFRVTINTAQCEFYAQKNFNDTNDVLGFLGVRTIFLGEKATDGQKRAAFKKPGAKRAVFCDFNVPRFSHLFSLHPDSAGRPIYVPDSSYAKQINDESDHGLWDMRQTPAIVSSGAEDAATDADLVKLADFCVKGWFDGEAGGLTGEGKKCLENPDSQENIGLSAEGANKLKTKIEEFLTLFRSSNWKEIKEQLNMSKDEARALQAKIEKAGANFPQMIMSYVKTSLHVHAFMKEGQDFKVAQGILFTKRINLRSLRHYVFRDKATGMDDFDMQFDLRIHKAVQAMIGAKVTDPGISPVAVTVPEYMQYVVHSNYSGTESPLAELRASEGGLTFSVDSSFARTRIDFPGVVYKTKGEQVAAIVTQAISDANEGACMVHAATAEGVSRGIVSINNVFEALENQFNGGITIGARSGVQCQTFRIEDLKELKELHDLRNDIEKKQNELNQVSDKSSPAASALQNEIDQLKRKYRDFLDSLKKNKPPQPGEKEKAIALVAVETKTDGTLETGERPFVVMRLTDIKDPEKQEAIADLIGSSRVITLTDIANRALNPGLRQLVSEAMTKEHVVLRSIVTEWKESVRTFLQEVARVGRPDPRLGYRAPGETRAIYCVEDSNFSPHMRSFLEWSVERNNGHPVVVLLPEFPEQISMSDLKGIAREFINSTGLSASDKKEIIDGIDKARSPQDIQRLLADRLRYPAAMETMKTFAERTINSILEATVTAPTGISSRMKTEARRKLNSSQETRTFLDALNVLGELVHLQKMKEKAVEQVDYLLRIQAINNLQAQTAKDGITAAKSPQKLTACLGNVGGQTATIVANYWQKTEAETVERKRTEDGSRGRIDRLINEIKNKLNMLQENSGRVTLDDFKMAALEILEATNEEAKKSNGGMREQNFTELCGQIKNARNAEEVTEILTLHLRSNPNLLDALKKVAASQIEELEKQGAISRNTKEAAAGQEAGEVGGEIAAATEAGPILKILFAFNNPDRILIREIFAPSFRTVIGQTLLECGIAEGNSDWKSPANIKKFTQAVRSRFGIVLEINPENFQTAGELQEAVVESVDELLDQAATDGQAKSRLRDILQARVSELQYQLESLRQEIEGNPALASQAAALRDNLERIIAREMCFILAEGERPVRRYNPIVANQRTGRPETGGTRTRIFTPRVRTVSCLGLRSGSRLPLLKVTAQPMPQPSDEAYKNRVEKILEHKIRALVDSGQDSADSTIQIKTADGRTLTFSLIQLDSDPGGRFFGIRALNHFLATLGPADSKSKKRIYFNPDTGEYIFGNARETHPQPETFTVASDKHAGLKKFFDENKEKFGNKYSFDEATGVLTVKGVMTAEEMSGGALGQFFNDTEMRTLYEQTKTMQRIVVFETEDVISPSIRDRAVAFVPRIPTNNFGTPDNCGECFETVIRQPAQEGFYRMLTEAAFAPHSKAIPASRFARALFEAQSIKDRPAAEEKINKDRVLKILVEVAGAHETGHVQMMHDGRLLELNQATNRHTLINVLYETLADIQLLKEAVARGKDGEADARTRIMAHLYYLSTCRAGERAGVLEVISLKLEECLGPDGKIDLKKLENVTRQLETLVSDKISEIHKEIKKISKSPKEEEKAEEKPESRPTFEGTARSTVNEEEKAQLVLDTLRNREKALLEEIEKINSLDEGKTPPAAAAEPTAPSAGAVPGRERAERIKVKIGFDGEVDLNVSVDQKGHYNYYKLVVSDGESPKTLEIDVFSDVLETLEKLNDQNEPRALFFEFKPVGKTRVVHKLFVLPVGGTPDLSAHPNLIPGRFEPNPVKDGEPKEGLLIYKSDGGLRVRIKSFNPVPVASYRPPTPAPAYSKPVKAGQVETRALPGAPVTAAGLARRRFSRSTATELNFNISFDRNGMNFTNEVTDTIEKRARTHPEDRVNLSWQINLGKTSSEELARLKKAKQKAQSFFLEIEKNSTSGDECRENITNFNNFISNKIKEAQNVPAEERSLVVFKFQLASRTQIFVPAQDVLEMANGNILRNGIIRRIALNNRGLNPHFYDEILNGVLDELPKIEELGEKPIKVTTRHTCGELRTFLCDEVEVGGQIVFVSNRKIEQAVAVSDNISDKQEKISANISTLAGEVARSNQLSPETVEQGLYNLLFGKLWRISEEQVALENYIPPEKMAEFKKKFILELLRLPAKEINRLTGGQKPQDLADFQKLLVQVARQQGLESEIARFVMAHFLHNQLPLVVEKVSGENKAAVEDFEKRLKNGEDLKTAFRKSGLERIMSQLNERYQQAINNALNKLAITRGQNIFSLDINDPAIEGVVNEFCREFVITREDLNKAATPGETFGIHRPRTEGKFYQIGLEHLSWLKQGAAGGTLRAKSAGLAVNATSGAFSGLFADATVQLIFEGKIDPKKLGEASLSWAWFNAKAYSLRTFGGLVSNKLVSLDSATAMVIWHDTAWGILETPFGQRGQALGIQAPSTAAFLGTNHLLGGWLKSVRGGGFISLTASIIVQQLATKELSRLIEETPGLKELLNSPLANSLGTVAGTSAPVVDLVTFQKLFSSETVMKTIASNPEKYRILSQFISKGNRPLLGFGRFGGTAVGPTLIFGAYFAWKANQQERNSLSETARYYGRLATGADIGAMVISTSVAALAIKAGLATGVITSETGPGAIVIGIVVAGGVYLTYEGAKYYVKMRGYEKYYGKVLPEIIKSNVGIKLIHNDQELAFSHNLQAAVKSNNELDLNVTKAFFDAPLDNAWIKEDKIKGYFTPEEISLLFEKEPDGYLLKTEALEQKVQRQLKLSSNKKAYLQRLVREHIFDQSRRNLIQQLSFENSKINEICFGDISAAQVPVFAAITEQVAEIKFGILVEVVGKKFIPSEKLTQFSETEKKQFFELKNGQYYLNLTALADLGVLSVEKQLIIQNFKKELQAAAEIIYRQRFADGLKIQVAYIDSTSGPLLPAQQENFNVIIFNGGGQMVSQKPVAINLPIYQGILKERLEENLLKLTQAHPLKPFRSIQENQAAFSLYFPAVSYQYTSSGYYGFGYGRMETFYGVTPAAVQLVAALSASGYLDNSEVLVSKILKAATYQNDQAVTISQNELAEISQRILNALQQCMTAMEKSDQIIEGAHIPEDRDISELYANFLAARKTTYSAEAIRNFPELFGSLLEVTNQQISDNQEIFSVAELPDGIKQEFANHLKSKGLPIDFENTAQVPKGAINEFLLTRMKKLSFADGLKMFHSIIETSQEKGFSVSSRLINKLRELECLVQVEDEAQMSPEEKARFLKWRENVLKEPGKYFQLLSGALPAVSFNIEKPLKLEIPAMDYFSRDYSTNYFGDFSFYLQRRIAEDFSTLFSAFCRDRFLETVGQELSKKKQVVTFGDIPEKLRPEFLDYCRAANKLPFTPDDFQANQKIVGWLAQNLKEETRIEFQKSSAAVARQTQKQVTREQLKQVKLWLDKNKRIFNILEQTAGFGRSFTQNETEKEIKNEIEKMLAEPDEIAEGDFKQLQEKFNQYKMDYVLMAEDNLLRKPGPHSEDLLSFITENDPQAEEKIFRAACDQNNPARLVFISFALRNSEISFSRAAKLLDEIISNESWMVPEITAAFSQSIIGGRKILWRNYLTEKISSSGTPNHLKRNLEEARLKLQVQDNKFFRFNQI